MTGNWRDRAGTTFDCQKQPASDSRGMVVSNHPRASAAGAACWRADGTPIGLAGWLGARWREIRTGVDQAVIIRLRG